MADARRRSKLALLLTGLGLAALTGCNSTAPQTPAATASPKAGATSPGSQDAGVSVSAKPVGGALGTISSGTAAAVPTGLSLNSFDGCGVTSFDPATSLGSQSIGSDSFNYAGQSNGLQYTLTVAGTLQLTGSLSQLTTSLQFNLQSASPPTAQAKASQEIAQTVNGSITSAVLAPSGWASLFSSGGWQGLHCGVVPVSGLTFATQAQTTQVSFTPALPYGVSPVISADRFHLEFPQARSFAVSATVTQSSTNKVQAGQSQSGTVTITPIVASGTATDNAGNPVTVNADYAFRVDNDFGSSTNTFGLYASASYYVKSGKIIVAIVNTGLANAPDVMFNNPQ